MELDGSLSCSQGLPLVPVLSQMKPLHTFPSPFFQTHFNILFPFMPRSSKQFVLSGFPAKMLHVFLFSLHCNIFHPCYHPWFYNLKNVWWTVQIMKIFITQFCTASHFFILLCPKIFLSTPFFNMLSLCSSLNVKTPSFIPIQNDRQNYSFAYFNFYILRQHMDDTRLDQMVTGIP